MSKRNSGNMMIDSLLDEAKFMMYVFRFVFKVVTFKRGFWEGKMGIGQQCKLQHCYSQASTNLVTSFKKRRLFVSLYVYVLGLLFDPVLKSKNWMLVWFTIVPHFLTRKKVKVFSSQWWQTILTWTIWSFFSGWKLEHICWTVVLR